MHPHIDRIPIGELTLSAFVERYYEPERPVLLTGAAVPEDTSTGWMRACFADPVGRRHAWHEAPLGVLDPAPLVAGILARADVHVRELPLRGWLHPGGHRTHFHYDGNGVHGFNLLVRGRKRWTLVGPSTPLPCLPFQFVAMVGPDFRPDPERHAGFTFDTGPGDLLFLPRFWFHEVVALDPVNMNLNWVFTPHVPDDATPVGRRERELLALTRRMPILRRRFRRSPNGADSFELPAAYSAEVPRRRQLARLLAELARFGSVSSTLRSVLAAGRALERSNFNAPDDPAPVRTP